MVESNMVGALKDLGHGILSQARNPWQYILLGFILCLVVYDKKFIDYKEGMLLVALGIGYIMPNLFKSIKEVYHNNIGFKFKVNKYVPKIDEDEKNILINEMISKKRNSYSISGVTDLDNVNNIQHGYNILNVMTTKCFGSLIVDDMNMTFTINEYTRERLIDLHINKKDSKFKIKDLIIKNKKTLFKTFLLVALICISSLFIFKIYSLNELEHNIKFLSKEDKRELISLIKDSNNNIIINKSKYLTIIHEPFKILPDINKYNFDLNRYQALEKKEIIRKINDENGIIQYEITSHSIRILRKIEGL